MKPSDFAVRSRAGNQGCLRGETHNDLQEIKVIEYEKHGYKYIDNHTGQNYNIEHF
jgi:hypothetical protein